MATNYFNINDHDLAAQIESTYGTDPGAVSGTDFFKHSAGADAFKRNIGRYDRDADRDTAQGSVLTTYKGREHSTISIPFDMIPNGSATPTAPDISSLLKVHFGSLHTGTAHTTTTSGSSGTTLNLTTGGVAASGVAVGDLIACDVSTTYGYEVRRVTALPGADVVTIATAFSANPATGRTVKVGTTYKFSSSASLLSATVKQFIGTSTKKNKITGAIFPDFSLDCDFSQESPVVKGSLTGMGQQTQSLSDTRPTITTNGTPVVPSEGKIWIGGTRFCATRVGLKSNNGTELRMNEACSLYPRGVKRTGNRGRFNVSMNMDLFYTSGDEDVHTLYDNSQSLTAQSVIVQLGITPGQIIAWACPRFIADPNLTEINGEFGVNFGGGRCYGTSGDDEIFFAII